MVEWLKLANPDDAGQHDPNRDTATLSPVPSVTVQNKPAPGHKGPRGMAPRTEYTRVNTGTPPTPDAGSESQKTVAPRGMEFLPGRAKTAAFQEKDSMTTMMRRPQLQDLVKEAMEGAARKVDINFEAARQLANLGEPERTKTAAPELSITPVEYIEKLAGALDYLAKQAAEDSANVGPGVGPGALEASAARSSGQVLEAGKGGQGIKQPPKDPPMQSSGVANDAATGLKDNMEMMHGEQPVDPMHNEKVSHILLQRNLARLGLTKTALAISPEGHAYDAAVARGQQHAAEQALLAARAYEDEAPIKSQFTGIGTGITGFPERMKARHLAYLAAKHEKEQNPLNPFGGMLTPTEAEAQLKRASADLYKLALSISPEGHAYDAAVARGQQHAAEQALLAARAYEDEAPIKSQFTGIGTGITGFPERMKARHLAYLAGKHEKEQNPLNPFGGMLTPTEAEAQLKGKSASAMLGRNLARLGLLKQAEDGDGEGGSPHISAGSAPAQGAEAPPGASPSGEQVPSEPSDVNAQKALISSNEAAINYTKRQAKADPKRDAGHVWEEPALSAAHDSVLQQAFDATPKAGVKISQDLTRVAAAQALLRKYAEEAKEKEKDKEKSKEKDGGPPNPALQTPTGQGSPIAASNM